MLPGCTKFFWQTGRMLRRAVPSSEDSKARSGGLVGRASPRAPRIYRLLIAGCRAIARVLGFRLQLEGAERLPTQADGRPAGGWIAAGIPHRTWIDPFVLALLLPIEPRINWLGDGRAIYRSRLRAFVFARIGGVIPIWPKGGRQAFDQHVEAARSVIDAGAVFGLFPEVGAAVPVDRARPLSPGIAYFALRTGAPIVPLILGGAHELFLGREIILSVLEPVTARELGGLAPEAPLPEPGTPEERDLAGVITHRLQALVAGPVADLHARAEPPTGTRKRWRWLTSWTH
jgi:1-acyl-sn-glycerol-3-phosphate acyltransferase